MEKKDLTLMEEGLAAFYIYNVDKKLIPSKKMNVFYNKRMEINRDISNLCINTYRDLFDQNELVIVDSMAASGVSAIRMLKECSNVKKIFINDKNPEAVKLIKKNIGLNDLDKENVQIEITNKDANLLFLGIASDSTERQKNPNIISIDPFGTPNIYIDSAFKAIQKLNGLMCITATDTAVLFGVRKNACIMKYLSKPLHTEYCKEIGARILISFVSRVANINKMGIIPLLTFYSGHFIRFFCLTFKNKKDISKNFKKFGYILHCNNCGYRSTIGSNILNFPKNCPVCDSIKDLDYAGPLWIGKIHDINFINTMLISNKNSKSPNKKRIEKLLTYAIEENDMPISYYNIHMLCQKLKLDSIPKIEDIINVIKELGHKCSRTHFDFLSIKSDLELSHIKKVLVEL
ncbi:MAG: tRNA (guanine(10)-N(2))-dimethyltransferase [Promethearchaeota archaeon]|nr:MAG: tRNA (guanine(10)-N(2))-dimethyltransferase [Candidatus Lokiarchaeota archaeon]